jgi:hypothetical protein
MMLGSNRQPDPVPVGPQLQKVSGWNFQGLAVSMSCQAGRCHGPSPHAASAGVDGQQDELTSCHWPVLFKLDNFKSNGVTRVRRVIGLWGELPRVNVPVTVSGSFLKSTLKVRSGQVYYSAEV